MNWMRWAARRAAEQGPIRVAVLGCGKFASMFLAQLPTMPAIEVVAIADLNVEGARRRLAAIGWDAARIAATPLTEDALAAIGAQGVEVVVEATGDPVAGAAHALAAIEAGRHLVMVNVEADVLCGAALAERARRAGLVYSMAYGDQPALIAELVDWARACGFSVVAAGKGTKYLPRFHQSTPETVWDNLGMRAEDARAGGMNPQMFNSFVDGTKSAIEMAAVANACDLAVPQEGLAFPSCGADQLAHILRPRAEGGQLAGEGLVEVVSSMERDGRTVPRDLRWGVYVVMKAPNAYTAACFAEYGLATDATGTYAALYRPYHLIGLELGVSVYAAALAGQPTGSTAAFRGDVVAVAKKDLGAGETLDGEGGYAVWGRLMPAEKSLAAGALPIGLAHGVRLKRPVGEGSVVAVADLEALPDSRALELRRECEAGLTAPPA
ncbi:NAD(P)H-dependent oxidoreductase [Afifella pfennigii]|uniref:NAD(P)H-dependent oxidoreductase n=1 Tax=Afifella pfennigii TaxID=209897 RepID=UPI00047EF0C0|nr:SAF domain-containing protein [Afifella pfennigii]